MGDVFQILIFLIIIISFIAPLFRKKDQQKKQQQQRQRSPSQGNLDEASVESTAIESKQQDVDVLKELENFFKVGNVEENQKENFIETRQKPEPEIKSQASGYKSEWERKKEEVEKVVKTFDKNIEKQSEKFEEQLTYQQTQRTNDMIPRIKGNIRKPNTLKEYIIFSEIIGKPKALRR